MNTKREAKHHGNIESNFVKSSNTTLSKLKIGLTWKWNNSTSTKLIASTKLTIKASWCWAYLMRVWITSNIGIKHDRAKINSRSHNIFKFSWANLVLSWLECIFTIKALYSTITCFNGLNMDIHWILTFLNNLRLLVAKVSTSFVNYKNFLKSWMKKKTHIATLI